MICQLCINELVAEIVTAFHKKKNEDLAFIVGIDGLSGAGKTTLVGELESQLKNVSNVVVIHIDDYIVERNKRYNTAFEEWHEYYYLQWDVEELKQQLFNKLFRNELLLNLPFYESSLDKVIQKTISVTPNSIILIEGVFLQRKEWKPYYDYAVFIDCSRETRYERVLERDAYIGDLQARLHKYKRRYWVAENYYIENVDPIKIADKVYK